MIWFTRNDQVVVIFILEIGEFDSRGTWTDSWGMIWFTRDHQIAVIFILPILRISCNNNNIIIVIIYIYEMIINILIIMRCSDFGEGTGSPTQWCVTQRRIANGCDQGICPVHCNLLAGMQVMGQCWIRCLVAQLNELRVWTAVLYGALGTNRLHWVSSDWCAFTFSMRIDLTESAVRTGHK